MGYQEALKATGAEVILYDTFGDYQGTWLALVNYHGKHMIIRGWYGSCSGCDAFEGEFGYDDATQEKLAEFGMNYILRENLTLEEARKSLESSEEWDMSAQDIKTWLDSVDRLLFHKKLEKEIE